MDEAETRRGEETIHVTYAARHRERGMRGDHTHYGESIAILLGDLAFAHAAQLMTRVPPACASIFFEMCADLMVGQFLDIESSARGPQRGSDVAGQITELKTARYTVEGPLLLGAAVAGRADELRPSIRAYGRPLGHAFQLGDSERTGKPVGDDLAQGKVTRLLEIGLARSDEAHHDLLERLGSPAMEPGDVERAQQVLIDCGARDEIETTIGRLVEDATAAIQEAPLLPEIREVLVGAAHLIANRDH
jgi:geranylgeranyl diphosphate synthase type I